MKIDDILLEQKEIFIEDLEGILSENDYVEIFGNQYFLEKISEPILENFKCDNPKGLKLNRHRYEKHGDKKFIVHVCNPKTGKIKTIRFGAAGMNIKKNNPERRKNFRARHGCDSDPRAKDKTTAKYWACKTW